MGLFLPRMRGIVGTDAVDDPLPNTLPEALLVAGIADRRVELGQRAEPLVSVGRGKREMGGRSLGGRDILVIRQKDRLFLGRDMQHMHALAGLVRPRDQALGTHQRGGGIAPHRVRTRIAFDAQIFSIVEPVLVLGVKSGATPINL